MRPLAAIGALTQRPRLLYAAIVAIALMAGGWARAPIFEVGLGSDDYPQHAMLDGVYPVKRSDLDLYNFYAGTPQEAKTLMDSGTMPWWNHTRFRFAMMRPLSSALIVLDRALFGTDSVGYHSHSLLWWAFLVICAALLFWELFPVHIAAAAAVLFAIEQGHGLPVLWLASRNALVSLSFGVAGLWAHIRWRRGGHRRALVLSIVAFSLALLAGEWAFAVFAYVFAFELLGVKGSFASRVRALMPAGILGLAFLIAQHALDYSALNSNVYVSPVAEPLKYVARISQRIPVLLADLVFGIPAFWYQVGTPWRSFVLGLDIFSHSTWKMLPSWKVWNVVIGVVGGVLFLLVLRWASRSCEDRTRRELRWMLLGSLLAMLPMVASFPGSRLALPASLGFSAAWSVILWRGFTTLRSSFELKRLKPVALALLIVAGTCYCQVWRTAIFCRGETLLYAYLFQSVREWVLRSDIDDTTVENQDVFLVNCIEHTVAFFAPFVRHWHGRPMPRSYRVLSAAPHAHDVDRTAPNALDMTVLGGTFLNSDLEMFYRATRFPLRKGDTVKLKGLEIAVVRSLRNRPMRVRFTFDKPLEDPSYVFLHSTPGGVRRFPLPSVGGRIRLPKAQMPSLALMPPPPPPSSAAPREAATKR